MDEAKRLRRDVVWNLVPVALLAIVGLGLNFLIGRWWDASALGAFNLVTPALFTFAVLGAGGLQFSVLRAVAEQGAATERVAPIVVGAIVPNVLFAALAGLLCFALARPIGMLVESERVVDGLRVVAPGVFCFAINKVLFAVVNGLRRMRAFAIFTSLRYLLIAIGLIVARIIELPGSLLPLIWTFAEAVILLVLIIEVARTVELGRAAGWFVWTKQHVSFGGRGLLATVALECNSKLDVWMLGVALPDSLVGIYALASSLFEGAMQLAVVVQNNLNPLLARELARRDTSALRRLVRQTRRWFVPTMVTACALGALVYPFVIPVLVGDPSFAAGARPFAILMAGLALSSPWQPFNQLLLMAARPGWQTMLLLCVVAISFGGNYLLIPVLGLSGAALAMAISTVASAALFVLFVRCGLGLQL